MKEGYAGAHLLQTCCIVALGVQDVREHLLSWSLLHSDDTCGELINRV